MLELLERVNGVVIAIAIDVAEEVQGACQLRDMPDIGAEQLPRRTRRLEVNELLGSIRREYTYGVRRRSTGVVYG